MVNWKHLKLTKAFVSTCAARLNDRSRVRVWVRDRGILTFLAIGICRQGDLGILADGDVCLRPQQVDSITMRKLCMEIYGL